MTNRELTTLIIRIAGLFLFLKIFDHFGEYFISVYLSSVIVFDNTELYDPMNKYYYTGSLLVIVNICLSLFLFIKANWIAEKLISKDNELKVDFTASQLTKVILLTTGVIWLAANIYLLPDFIEYCINMIKIYSEDAASKPTYFDIAKYITRTIVAIFLILRSERITKWITSKF